MSDVEQFLRGQHAVVTGASRGIGAAIASELAKRGASVTIMARSAESLRVQGDLMRAGGARVHEVTCDVTNDADVQRAFSSATQALGVPSVLVNNAGNAHSAIAADTTRLVWDEMLAVNLTGTWSCTQQVLPAMLAARSGRVVNVASTAGLRGYKTMTAYCAAKHGVIGLTRALAQETAKHGVTVNAVCPGYTETDLVERAVDNVVSSLGKTPDEARAMLVRIIPRGVLTSPEEVAAAVAWLCAPSSGAITGVALPIAGGEIG